MTQNGSAMNSLPEKRHLRVGVLGLGTVGQSVVGMLQRNSALYAARVGCTIEIVAVSARSKSRERSVDIADYAWFDNPLDMISAVDLVIEVAGGFDPAGSLAQATLSAGKHWVSANKALLAERGRDLIALAQQTGAQVGFEAAVCTAIPIVKTLREAMAANTVGSVQGILNGTCNYISAQMSAGMNFDDALADATVKGYAEADPTLDIGGGDAAHKITLMAGLISGAMADFNAVHVEGIDALPDGITNRLAAQGYVLKLLGQCRPQPTAQHDDAWAVWVYPAAVPQDHALADIHGVTNAVAYHGNAAGVGMLQGVGAGGDATASAVLADVLDIAAGRGSVAGGLQANMLNVSPISERVGRYFVAGAQQGAAWQNYTVVEYVDALLVQNIREADLLSILETTAHEYWIRVEGE